LQSMIFIHFLYGTRCQVPFLSNASISSCIACFHLGSTRASSRFDGSPVEL
jgi:hypothetical protein